LRDALPGQLRIEHSKPVGDFFAAVLRAVVRVRYLEIERDGVAIVAEAEMDQIARWVSEVDRAVVDEFVVSVIDELTPVVYGSESAVFVEDVVMLQPTIYSMTRVIGVLAALSGIASAELRDAFVAPRLELYREGQSRCTNRRRPRRSRWRQRRNRFS
jgi:hypothetical protein